MARLKLLGSVECEDDGERLDGLSARRHPIAILALLTRASSRTLSRSKLVGYLWPETREQTARSRLSTHVHEIRRELGEEVLLSEGDDLRLNRDVLSCDVWHFEEAVQAEAWDRAVELYRGPFLDGFRLPDSPSFGKWLDVERAELRRGYHGALEALADEAAERGEPVAAARWRRRRAEEDPFDSRVVVQLMDALVAAGNPAEALQVAHVHEQLLAEELDAEPSPEVRKRTERIEAGTADGGPRKDGRTAASGSLRENMVAPDRASERESGDQQQEEAPTAGSDVDLEPAGTRVRGRLIGLARLSVVVLLLLAAVGAVWYLSIGGRESPGIDERTVAVLPFQVSGSGADAWRDGMVTLLSTNLDGAAGLRTVADRAVFAALEEQGYGAETTSTEQALEVARQVGGGYAVVGSASQLGEELRLTARLYETQSGDRLNQVEVSGAEKAVTSLADSLTREMLPVLLAESDESLPSVEVASVTTRSLPALKSFLAGERHLLAGEYEPAIEAFEAAVEADSTFALAYLKLSRANGWTVNREARIANLERAYRLSDQLPERERRTVQANYWWHVDNRARAAADTLRRLTETYPDDPILWYTLGEILWHSAIPRGWPQADQAFKRASELDPGHAIYYPHYAQLGIAVHHDSALAAERIASLPREDWREAYRIPLDLAFGGPDARRDALTRLDTIPLTQLYRLGPWHSLSHPAEVNAYETMLGRLREREDSEEVFGGMLQGLLAANSIRRGQVREGLSRGQQDWIGQCQATYLQTVGVPVPDSLARPTSDPSALPGNAPSWRLRCVGLFLIQNDRGDQLAPVLGRLRETAEGQEAQRWIDELEGYQAWKSGSLEEALRLWEGRTPSGTWGALWRGDLYRELGQLEKAEGWYLAGWLHPVTHERLGQLYEEMGQPEKAANAYRRFIGAWKNADPELQAEVEEARIRLAELPSGGGRDPE